MKKIYTLIAIVCLTFGANAQGDLQIAFTGIAAGSSQPGGAVDGGFSITNNSSTIPMGDTLWFGMNVDNVPYSFNLTLGGLSYSVLTAPFTGGTTLNFANTINFTSATGNPANVCIVAYGTDRSLIDTNASASSPYPLTTTWDQNFNDNSVCFTYTPFITSIQELNEMTDKVFFANGQLVYDWTNMNEAHEAQITMTSINGQTVLSKNVELNEGRNRMNVNNLATGLYLVTFQVNGEASTAKVYVK